MSDEMHYVRNADLIPEVELYGQTKIVSERLGKMFLLIAKNLSNKSNYINYTWKEDMIQEAVMTCCRYIGNFDLNKSTNPFAYITTICDHSFKNYINKQKRHSEIKDRCFNNRGVLMEDEMIALTNKAIDYTMIARGTGVNNFDVEVDDDNQDYYEVEDTQEE